MFTQRLSQASLRPPWPVQRWQLPPEQTLWPSQTIPQPPQLFGSFCVS
jgi:hypothetical protein